MEDFSQYDYFDECNSEELLYRRLWLKGKVESDAVDELISSILNFNNMDFYLPVERRKPIFLFIDSTDTDGDEFSSLNLANVIEASKTPVYTVNIGHCCLGAFMIFLAGKIRFSIIDAVFLYHELTMNAYLDWAEFDELRKEKVNKYIVSHSKREDYRNEGSTEQYFLADEAKAKGFVDWIIGVDCVLDDVIGSVAPPREDYEKFYAFTNDLVTSLRTVGDQCANGRFIQSLLKKYNLKFENGKVV